MFLRFALLGTVSALAILGASAPARADLVISATLPGPVNGPVGGTKTFASLPYTTGNVAIGTFTYTVPVGYTITAAYWSGQWGTGNPNTHGSCNTASNCPHTAIQTIEVAGVAVANCPSTAATCWTETTTSVANYTFTSGQYAALYGPNAVALSDQTGPYVVRLGSETLTIDAQAPEPASILLFGTGLLGLGAIRRRWSSSAARLAGDG